MKFKLNNDKEKMMLPVNRYYVLGKVQLYSFNIFTEKYNNHLPFKLTQNRPPGILRDILNMMKNEEDYQAIINCYGNYFVN